MAALWQTVLQEIFSQNRGLELEILMKSGEKIASKTKYARAVSAKFDKLLDKF